MKANNAISLLLLIGFSALPCACNQYTPYAPDTSNLEGVWSLDNDSTRRIDEEPIMKRLEVYATHMELSPGQGKLGVQGEWKTDGFWCQAKDGSGVIEAAKVLNADEIELHLAAFYSGSTEVLILYKVRGSDDEEQAQAAKYPQTITYPPPKGAIPVGLSEYKLGDLPWKPDKIMRTAGDDTAVYSYHSDDPNLTDLRVTVENHKVIAVNGGNE